MVEFFFTHFSKLKMHRQALFETKPLAGMGLEPMTLALLAPHSNQLS